MNIIAHSFYKIIYRTKSKAQKLKVYYEKLCEDESKSQRRNQQLLSDLKRIDSNFQELETKLERLTHVKVSRFRKLNKNKNRSYIISKQNNIERDGNIFQNCPSEMDH